jgi:hypothetical protein
MGVDQVLRVAVAIAVAAAAAAPSALAAPVVAVIDARGDDATTTALVDGFTAAGLEVVAGDRAAAARGRDDDDLAIDRALAEASDGYGQLDCGRARPWAERAALMTAGRTAAGLDERTRAGRAWSYLLLCADRDGDRAVARHAAERVRALGAGAAIGADVWSRYPDIDATLDRDVVALTVTGPAGAVATIDDRVVGPVPATALVGAGVHVVAVGAPGVRGAAWARVAGKPLTVEVAARQPDDAVVVTVAAAVQALRGGATIDAAAVEAVARALDVELVAVVGADGVGLWQRRRGATTSLTSGEVAAVVAAGRAAYDAAHDRAPDPSLPLVREPRTKAKVDKDPTRWWVYAAIGGAVLAGAAAIYAADAGDDRQRFELVFP